MKKTKRGKRGSGKGKRGDADVGAEVEAEKKQEAGKESEKGAAGDEIMVKGAQKVKKDQKNKGRTQKKEGKKTARQTKLKQETKIIRRRKARGIAVNPQRRMKRPMKG